MYEDGFGCLHTKGIFGRKMKVYPFAKKIPFYLHMSRTMRPYLRRKKSLLAAFSPAGPKGCSKDDERVLKGCLCLCHPSHNLFFCRKLLYGALFSFALLLTALPLLRASTPRLPHAVHNRTTARKLAFPIS